MSKVMFSQEDESVLKQWEQMHRPPDTIPTSGPAFARAREPPTSRAGLIVQPSATGSMQQQHQQIASGRGSSGRRHSVISSSKDVVSSFPLKTGGERGSAAGGGGNNNGHHRFSFGTLGQKIDMRRPSEVWLGKH